MISPPSYSFYVSSAFSLFCFSKDPPSLNVVKADQKQGDAKG